MKTVLPTHCAAIGAALVLAAARWLNAAEASPPASAPVPPALAATQPALRVQLIADSLRAEYKLDPFYIKACIVDGIPIIGSKNVSDPALLECAWTLDHLLHGRTMALDALTRAKVRVGVIAVTEYTMDIPEYKSFSHGAFNDKRSRGLGGIPLSTCAEENLLSLRGDPYSAENITIHEFSHTLASAIKRVNPDWYRRLRGAYEQAMAGGAYGASYAATNEQEYWAEGAQAWFDCANPHNSGGNATREQLKARDPGLAELLAVVYGDGPWRYAKTTSPQRPEQDRAHLAGLNREAMPIFDFRNSPRIKALAAEGSKAPHRDN